MKYAGSDWLQNDLSYVNKTLSPLGEEVANILGQVFRGIYHIEKVREAADWEDDFIIQMRLSKFNPLSTYDSSGLTLLILLCHDRAIRLEIRPLNFDFINLYFHRRKRGAKSIMERHPSMEDAIQSLRDAAGLEVL